MKHQRGIWLLNEIPLTYYYLLDFEINLKFFFNTKLWDYLFVLRNIHKFKSVISLQKERRSISSILWFASVAFHFIVVGHKTHPMQRIGLAFPIKSFWMFPISLLKKLPPSLRNCNNYNGFLEFCRRLWIESSLTEVAFLCRSYWEQKVDLELPYSSSSPSNRKNVELLPAN